MGAELAKAADGLAALHDSGIEHGEVVTWEEELGDVRNLIAAPRAAARRGGRGLDVPRRARGPQPPVRGRAAGACHRSFRPAQVLLHHGRIAFIDFDGLAMAEPALDVALFRAAVRDVGAGALLEFGIPSLRSIRPSTPRRACDGFLARYRSHRPVSPERVVLWETLDLVTYVLRWTKIKPERLVTRMTLLDRHIATAGLG